MKKFLLSIMLAVLASVAWAADPKPYLALDAAGNPIVKSGLPKGTLIDWKLLKFADDQSLLCLTWAENGRGKLAIFSVDLSVYDGPQPNPEPDPTPPPVPPPIPVQKIWGVVILSESKTRTPAQGAAIISKAIADYAAAKGWNKTAAYDPDMKNEKDETIPVIASYRARAKSDQYFFVVGEQGAVIAEDNLVDEKTTIETLKKVGG